MTKPASRPKAPSTLSAPARDLWRSLVAEYGIADAAGLSLLQAAMQSWDRAAQARELIARDGPLVQSGSGPRAHPAIAMERDALRAFLTAMRQLNFDVEPLRDGPGRPPGV